MIRNNARAIDLPAERHDARVVSHCFARRLPSAIGDRRPHYEIIETAPFAERNLESSKQSTEECDAGPAGQFPDLVRQASRNCGKPSVGWAGCDWRVSRSTQHRFPGVAKLVS